MGRIEDQLCQMYRSSHTEYIDYWVGGLHITSTAFREVADAIEHHLITVTTSREAGLAVYNSRTDNLAVQNFSGNLASPNNVSVAALALHEAVHVWCDMHAARSVDPISEEVAAYIAQAVYTHRVTGSTNVRTVGRGEGEARIFDAVFQVCLDHSLLGHHSGTIAHLSRADIREARQAVQDSHLYRHLEGLSRSEHHDGLARSRSCGVFGMSRCEPPTE